MDLEKTLQEATEKARRLVEKGADEGHQTLIEDLAAISKDAKECQFHDLLNDKYEAPKVKLCAMLMNMITKAQTGEYDNNL